MPNFEVKITGNFRMIYSEIEADTEEEAQDLAISFLKREIITYDDIDILEYKVTEE